MDKAGVQYDIQFKIDEVNGKLTAIESQLKSIGSTGSRQATNIESSFSGLGDKIMGYLAIGTIISGLTSLAGSIISVRSDFEKYEAILTNSYGSADIAAQKMAMLRDTAKSLPAELTTLAQSFVLLQGRGIEPTGESLTQLSDFASTTGKDIGDLTQAILDVNNTERWKEFGIKASTAGDKVEFSFRKAKIAVENTEAGAMKAIQFFAQMPGIAGTSAAQMETLGGKTSNFKDAWDQLLNTLGEGGIWKKSIGYLTEFTSRITDAIKGTERMGSEYGQTEFSKFTDSLKDMAADEAWNAIGSRLSFLNEQLTKTSAELSKRRKANKGGTNFLLDLFGWEAIDTDQQVFAVKSYQEEIKKLKALMNDPEAFKKVVKPEGTDVVKTEIETLETLRAKLKELQDAYEGMDVTNKKGLLTKYQEIEALKLQISNLENISGYYREKVPSKLQSRGTDANVTVSNKKLLELVPTGQEITDRGNSMLEAYRNIMAQYGTITERKEVELADLVNYYDKNKLEYDETYYNARAKIEQKYLKEQIDRIADLSGIIKIFDKDLGESFDNMVSGFSSIASGDIAGGIANIITGAQQLEGIVSGSNKAAAEQSAHYQEQAAWLNYMTAELSKQLAITNELKGVDIYTGYDVAIRNTEKDLQDIQGKIQESRAFFTGFSKKTKWTIFGTTQEIKKNTIDMSNMSIDEIKKVVESANKNDGLAVGFGFIEQKDLDLLNDYISQYDAAQKQITDLRNKYNESVTGSTYDGILSSIRDAFDDGLMSAEEFANSFEEMMKTAVLRSFEIQFLEKQIQSWYDSFAEANKDGQLTTDEREQLQKDFQKKMDEANAGLKGLMDAAGMDFSKTQTTSTTANSLSAGIKSITEDTANVLAGQMGAIRITVLEQKNIALQGLSYLQEIAANTSYCKLLSNINDSLKANNSLNTDRAYGR